MLGIKLNMIRNIQQLLGFCVYFNINISVYILIFLYFCILLFIEHKGDVSPEKTKPRLMFRYKMDASILILIIKPTRRTNFSNLFLE